MVLKLIPREHVRVLCCGKAAGAMYALSTPMRVAFAFGASRALCRVVLPLAESHGSAVKGKSWHTRSPLARRSISSMRLSTPASTSRARRSSCVLSPAHNARTLLLLCPEQAEQAAEVKHT